MGLFHEHFMKREDPDHCVTLQVLLAGFRWNVVSIHLYTFITIF